MSVLLHITNVNTGLTAGFVASLVTSNAITNQFRIKHYFLYECVCFNSSKAARRINMTLGTIHHHIERVS